MRFIDLFKLSTRMFRARTSRTLLTILGMGIGIGAILFLVSLGYGLQKTLLEKITTAESLLTLDVTEVKSGVVSLDRGMLEKIKNIGGVSEISPAFQTAAQGKFEDISADLSVITTKPSFLRLGGIKVPKGNSLNEENKEQVIISSSISQVFGKSADELMGKEISFTFYIPKEENIESSLKSNFETFDPEKKYTIAGVIESDENIVYVNLDSLENMKIEKYSQLKVKCENSVVMGQIRDKILAEGLLVSSLSDTVEQANQIFRVIQIILMLFGIIALVVSAIGMFNTMTIALLERTEEIGIMKSIGATDGAISVMFIMESAIMGFLGGLGGVAIGLLGGELFNGLVNFIAKKLGGEPVDLFSSPLWFILLIIIFAAVVGFFTGIVPARRASKIDPLDALRYK
ncbi:MAG: hypothetical protein A3J63_01895 [Candidatus Moranbacteria bacterium RIFCSPHIGHO2_02_FULL_40_12b]|nr:MAG: hypothetical protein A3J63_01895 [Candidatus Moranbacteria bacterium RIFCSPHIGHO2_02_FULL_40_12b]